MREYYSILLEDEDAQVNLEITEIIDEPLKPIAFIGNFSEAENALGFYLSFTNHC